MISRVATVAVDNTFFSFDTDYSYLIPADANDRIEIGCQVKVPFGRGDRLRDGIVIAFEEKETNKLKTIHSLGDKVLSDESVKLALWLKERCFCTTYDCLKQMLPRRYGSIKSKSAKMVRLCTEDESILGTVTKKQRIVVDLLLDVGTAEIGEICSFCSVGVGVVKNLIKNNIAELFEKEIYRNPYSDVTEVCERDEIVLSEKQNNAYRMYEKMLAHGGTGLLFGITGSGKTQVYLKLIDDTLDRGRDIIVMVPEISLTPQMLDIFHKRYGKRVAVFHSGLSLGERNDEYRRADSGEAKIVIGTRSAVFAPLHNLGLIVIDEEQEHTYKSERTPRYDAKDVARFRAKYNNALLLLTSATPSIESFSLAKAGKYELAQIDERYGEAQLPEVITVDMKRELKLGNKSPISTKLKELIQENLDNGMQTMLLINRRGYNTFIACNECGHIITCPHCSISMTYHSYNNRLMCHYCGYSKTLDHICPKCKSDAVRYSGYGTQRIESELELLFPDAGILRMDADTTTAKFSHQKLLDSFKNGEYDILIGTQMIAKGLDFEKVTLVGVVNADNSLYDESYTAAEKSFDLITQIVGRAGRRGVRGKAVIQTINPYNETLEYASNQDYLGFYKSEMAMRSLMIYPPYCDIYSVIFTAEKENDAALCSKEFYSGIVELTEGEYSAIKVIVLGPTPAKISKINNSYRYRLAIKCKNSSKIRNMITEIIKKISKMKEYRDVSITIDLNPKDMV